MANIFKAREEYSENVNRSSFDLSHRNNFTTKIGQITPILCQECVPGDSFQIKTDLGLRFSPMVFPIQTPLVATVQYFKVPHRILWENFEDFVGDTKDGLVHPYIAKDYMWHPTGSLADYLGVPSTYASDDHLITRTFGIYGVSRVTREIAELAASTTISGTVSTESATTAQDDFNGFTGVNTYSLTAAENPVQTNIETFWTPYQISNYGVGARILTMDEVFSETPVPAALGYAYVSAPIGRDLDGNTIEFETTVNGPVRVYVAYSSSVSPDNVFRLDEWTIDGRVVFELVNVSGNKYTIEPQSPTTTLFADYYADLKAVYPNIRLVFTTDFPDTSAINYDGTVNFGFSFNAQVLSYGVVDVTSADSPFVIHSGEEFPEVRINALPFRAYESIYNCYFRTNTDVDPFIRNGQPEYNKWVTNISDGADSITPLDLKFRNFELDYLTSAKNSPQQGEAPLVGVSATGTFTFEDENGTQYTAKAIIDENDRLTGIDTYDPELPKASLHRLMDTITHGISINDLRNVSAFQKWKDQNLRRGYRYKDQIMSHFGVDAKSVHYDDPQFIGGMTTNVNVQPISSSTSTSEISLGEYGGQASLFKQGDHTVTCYCDEHCFIIGLLTIVPIPVYSQSLDPMFVKTNMLSYHFPEFNHISMQPIAMKYVTPIESYRVQKQSGENELDKTFGYQRPQWEMVSKIDTAHSHMRTDMSNYLMTRYFQNPPELGHDFLVINPDELTSPFVDTDASADNIVGQIYFDISAQRPVSRMAIPRIEP